MAKKSGNPVVLVMGFNHWGKSTFIRDLFLPPQGHIGSRPKPLDLKGTGSMWYVLQYSNDDWGLPKFLRDLRVYLEADEDRPLLVAFCPTMEESNKSQEAIDLIKGYRSRIHALLLVDKWDNRAMLKVKPIKNAYHADIRDWCEIRGLPHAKQANLTKAVNYLRALLG